MRVLLVHPLTPKTYWGFQYSLRIAGKSVALPPLGLASLAALLPSEWELRIADLNLAPLRDEQIRWADAVMVTGMLVHSESIHRILARARSVGRRTFLGGPAATAMPDQFPDADYVFCGEAEGRLGPLLRAVSVPGSTGRILAAKPDERPEMSAVPAPRFDLLDHRQYSSMSIQYSRGCPFRCEFCDIIEVFGRRPRVKTAHQLLSEMGSLYRTGYRGPLFFVDDNFIGNRRAVAAMLPQLAEWQAEHGWPFDLYTEASIDLADHPELVTAMVAAGFTAVFVGLESPSLDSLRETGKHQNLRLPPTEAINRLLSAGLEVYAGFIVGFDSDGPEIFDAQGSFISSLPIPLAMIGLLTALPGTALWRRLEREGRIRALPSGDQFDRPNFQTNLDERVLLAGYRDLLATLYAPRSYYERCEQVVGALGGSPAGGKNHLRQLATLLRAALRIGVLAPHRRHFWQLLFHTGCRAPRKLSRAVALAIKGEHLIRYTREDVLPRLEASLGQLQAAS